MKSCSAFLRAVVLPASFPVVFALICCSCDQSGTFPATAPTTAPTSAGSQRPATRPTQTVLSISGEQNLFRPMRVMIDSADTLTLTFVSGDPQKEPDVDSVYLEMQLDCQSRNEIPSTVWNFTADTNDFVEKPVGIFLPKSSRQLQPARVTAEFTDLGEMIHVKLEGEFFLFDTASNDKLIGRSHIAGEFDAVIEPSR